MKSKEELLQHLAEINSELENDMLTDDYKDDLSLDLMKTIVQREQDFIVERELLLWILDMTLEDFKKLKIVV